MVPRPKLKSLADCTKLNVRLHVLQLLLQLPANFGKWCDVSCSVLQKTLNTFLTQRMIIAKTDSNNCSVMQMLCNIQYSIEIGNMCVPKVQIRTKPVHSIP